MLANEYMFSLQENGRRFELEPGKAPCEAGSNAGELPYFERALIAIAMDRSLVQCESSSSRPTTRGESTGA